MDLVVLSLSMTLMVVLSMSTVGYMEDGFSGLSKGFVIGLVLAYICLILLNYLLGAGYELISYADTELKTFQPHWFLLGYGTSLSELGRKEKTLQAAVNEAANLFDKMAAVSETTNFFQGRIYSPLLLETAFDMNAVSLLSEEESRHLQQLGHSIREHGVEILSQVAVWLLQHACELASSRTSLYKLFDASASTFSCDEYTLARLSFLDIGTFLGVYFDTHFELLAKVGWSPEHILQQVFIPSPQPLLYQFEINSTGGMWSLKKAADT